MRHSAILLLLVLLLPVVHVLPLAHASETAEQLFANHRQSVFQIRLVDTNANEKKVIGSGFRVGNAGFVATNYHVISDSVYESGRYRIEAVDDQNNHYTMTLRAVDIVHDLALLAFADSNTPDPALPALAIDTSPMPQGTSVFSLGNPHDIGMMIVDGQYNGPVKDSRFNRLIFSGDINSGMSGGPAINAAGQVIGINVASEGDGIGYLVPASYLQSLLDLAAGQSKQPLALVAGQQLLADQQDFYSRMLSAPWNMQTLAELQLPGELHPSIKCWGHSEEEKNRLHDASEMHCSNRDDYLFVLDDKYLGNMEYRYTWVKALDLNRFQLYSLVEDQMTFDSTLFNNYSGSWNKHEVTEYDCKTGFVNSGGGRWRTVFCTRHYKLFPGLFDIGLLMASIDHNDRSVVIEMTAAGISADNATELTGKFMRSVSWQP